MGARWKRQIPLFLFTILAPAVVLVTLTARVVTQERDLAAKRVDAAQRDALDQLRRELAARLEAIKLEGAAAGPAVAFVAPMEQDRMILPWDDNRVRPRPWPELVTYRKQGEADEFLSNSALQAEHAYRKALASARSLAEKCESRLEIGRVLFKAGNAKAATVVFQSMMTDCDSAADDDGISFGLYAADRLIEDGINPSSAIEYVTRKASAAGWQPLIQAYLVRSLLEALPQASPIVRQNLSKTIHDMEQMTALASNLHVPMFRMGFPFGAHPGDSAWLAYGDEPWLITVFSPAPMAVPIVMAVSSSKITPPGAKFVAVHTAASTPVGEGFLNLEVEWPSDRFASAGAQMPLAFYGAGLALILSATTLAGYLLLRDVMREARIAEMRAHFVASVSHELKTPLTSIRMFAETLGKQGPPDERRRMEYSQTIMNESERLSRLVDNLLDSSRIEYGEKAYRKQWICMADVVRSAAGAMGYPLSQKGFRLNISIEQDMPAILADSDAIEQAILNLLTNAMKYSGDARDIDLSLKRSGNEAAIEVVDRGLGIDEKDQKRIFERFYRVRSADNDRVTGAGLGLALAYHIVAAHGGKLEVSSAPGRGSTFCESSGLVLRVAFFVVRNREDAEDIAQEAFMKAYRSFESLRDWDRFHLWVARIAWRTAIDHRRASRLQVNCHAITEYGAPFPNAMESVLESERSNRLWEAIDTLPEKLRNVLILVTIQEQEIATVANTLDLPAGTVKSRLFRARDRLRKLLEHEGRYHLKR